MKNLNLKIILAGLCLATWIIWGRPIYLFVHEQAIDRGIANPDKVALYLHEDALNDTFKTQTALEITKIEKISPTEAQLVKIYPIFLRYKKGGGYYFSYPEVKWGKPTILTNVNAKKVSKFDYYYKDEIQLSLTMNN